jgi:hypothetical protein
VRALLDLAQRLQTASDVHARLAENAAGDPLPAARRQIRHMLDRTASRDRVTRLVEDERGRLTQPDPKDAS